MTSKRFMGLFTVKRLSILFILTALFLVRATSHTVKTTATQAPIDESPTLRAPPPPPFTASKSCYDIPGIEAVHENNHRVLSSVPKWITKEDWHDSNMNYGVPHGVLGLLDKDVGEVINLSDLVSYLATRFNKGSNYLEIGVSVGKTLFQVMNSACDLNVFAFDLERINPTFHKIIEPWFNDPAITLNIPAPHAYVWEGYKSPMHSKPCTVSEFKRAHFRDNIFTYVNCDEFDRSGWNMIHSLMRVNDTPSSFQIIYSDALHTESAIKVELEEIMSRGLLDRNQFAFVWDDMGLSVPPFCEQIVKYANPVIRYKITCVVGKVYGWFGVNEAPHSIAIITTLNIADIIPKVFQGPVEYIRRPASV